MTARDRTVVMVLVIAAMLAAFWFGILAPKRSTANSLQTQITASKARLTTAQQSVTAALSAQRGYASDYATVARLGKAVPDFDDVPSLVYQLQNAASGVDVQFGSIKTSSTSGGATAPVAATPSAQVAALGKEQKGQSTSTAPPPAPVDATQAAASVLPPGATVGAAGFPVMPFDFHFDGGYFPLEKFLSRLNQFTAASATTRKLSVRGRLLTVDGIAMKGFPGTGVQIKATAFLLPADEGLTAGATALAPAGATTPATQKPSSTTAPQIAAITGVG